MNTGFKETLIEKLKFLRSRARIMALGLLFLIMLSALCARLFNLQIVNGKPYVPASAVNSYSTVVTEALRGEIYDRYGRPLAVNKTVYSVKIDPSACGNAPEYTATIENFVKLLIKNGEEINTEFKISEKKPHEYSFGDNKKRELRWLMDMGVLEEGQEDDVSADDAYTHLLEFFGINQSLSEHEKYLTVALCSDIFMQRYALGHITVTSGAKESTVVTLEERNSDFQGIYVETDYLREYPEGEYVSHIIGYIRPISAEEYESNKALGYTNTDLIGKDGIEKFFELNLRGIKGEQIVQISPEGRRAGIESERAAIPGDNVYLTIDVTLQKKTFEALKKELTEILINKIKGGAANEEPITPKQAAASMLRAGTISVTKILAATDDELYSASIKAFLKENYKTPPSEDDYINKTEDFIATAVEENKIAVMTIFGVMSEQEIITFSEQAARNEKQFLISKLESGEITPQTLALSPYSGSAIVENPNTGEILAAVTYPVYDNNRLVNDFDEAYYNKLLSDPTKPLINRPFAEKLAPGSTFKMITAISALENDMLTPTERIYDELIYTKAGYPHLRCWSGASHGNLTVADALEVSCNFFFNEAAFRLGNSKTATTVQGIDKLNDTMIEFGLNEPCGVEVYEPYGYSDALNISSPSLKERKEKLGWTDGDTIRTAIGQALNAYSPANMVKYISMLATGGSRYSSHFLNFISDYNGKVLSRADTEPEYVADFAYENLQAVYEGMLQVTGFQTGTG
ncbi:MAG: hypothetical protein LBM16_05670, partial [Clostridiales bacterium]|nr:hypothetical protein [Clostridiales bacterium]